ncbi:uncharacterized protein LOC123470312 isoform X2 [Daphnia magna]|uniref:uncharacterized protein LOC123470312 isoform X2 n=1 Tax=Daphnia magna TaxID=35525 RepID=UPI001E1BB736|nr:uncharacterized protein LOC123470312 isoform X2 [Daphnia magna]
MVSYAENVAKLIEVCRNFGNQASIKCLWEATFEGRRQDILSNKFANVAHLLQTACPVRNQVEYLHREFELIKGAETCQKFMANWIEYVPLIIKLASKVKNSQDAISKVFDMYNAADINKTFDINACIALELLPHLLHV